MILAERGTPEWLLERHSQELLDRTARFDRLEAYYNGDHPIPVGDRRYRNALRVLQDKARTNYTALVADTPVERMHVNGFRFGKDQPADSEADRLWQLNDMDLQSGLVHLMASVFGQAYVLVVPPGGDLDYPAFLPLDPRLTIVERHPLMTRLTTSALMMWTDETEGRAFAVVMTPDEIVTWSAPATAVLSAYPTSGLTNQYDFGPIGRAWTLESVEANPLGKVPIVQFRWRMSFSKLPMGEFEPILPIQDRINGTILDRMIISRAQAYKQRWASGINVSSGEDGKPKPPFDPGADILWATTNEAARFGEFREADIRQVLEAVRNDVQDLAAITKTPPHYLIGEIVNASGDALKASEAGLVAKVKERTRSMGQSWEEVIRLGFLALGDHSRAEEPFAETLWADPEARSRAELADAVLKESTIGVPFGLLMERLQYTPQQIERAKVERQAEDTRRMLQMAQEARLMNRVNSETAGPNQQRQVQARGSAD